MTCQHCDKPVLSRGLCSAHYNRWWRTGAVERYQSDLTPGTKARVCAECQDPDRPVVARSMCRRCWSKYEWRRRNNPDTWEGWPHERIRNHAKDRLCACGRKAYARGLCRPEYRKLMEVLAA